MTPIEIWEECRKLEAEVGPKSEVCALIMRHSKGVSLQVYPRGMCESSGPNGEGETWTDAFDDVRTKWAAQSGDHERNLIRDISLAIVRITYDNGECTDAALRAEFAASDIAKYAERAIERANAMAEGAPFKIIETGDGNGSDYE